MAAVTPLHNKNVVPSLAGRTVVQHVRNSSHDRTIVVIFFDRTGNVHTSRQSEKIPVPATNLFTVPEPLKASRA